MTLWGLVQNEINDFRNMGGTLNKKGWNGVFTSVCKLLGAITLLVLAITEMLKVILG